MIPIIYDHVNEGAVDEAFFIELLDELPIQTIADIGCGTGRITVQLAKKGYDVTAVDPHEGAIALAKMKPHAQHIQWHVATSDVLASNTYDAVMMTANVAQVFLGDDDFQAVLHDAYRVLKTGGHLLFDTRNKDAKIWEAWMADTSLDAATHVETGEALVVETTYEPYDNDVFTFYETVRHATTNEVLAHEKIALKFRSIKQIEAALQEAGFQHISVYGDWVKRAPTATSQSLIFHCVK